MQKRKLKNWVKELILAIICFIVVFVSILCIKDLTDKSIDQCVNSGNSYNYCVEGLK